MSLVDRSSGKYVGGKGNGKFRSGKEEEVMDTTRLLRREI